MKTWMCRCYPGEGEVREPKMMRWLRLLCSDGGIFLFASFFLPRHRAREDSKRQKIQISLFVLVCCTLFIIFSLVFVSIVIKLGNKLVLERYNIDTIFQRRHRCQKGQMMRNFELCEAHFFYTLQIHKPVHGFLYYCAITLTVSW